LQDKNSIEVQLVINDLHIPYQDKDCVELVLKFAKFLQPDKLFILGDFIDNWSISKFLKDPARKLNLKSEIKQGREVIDRINTAIPKAEKFFIFGNHEDRLRKFLWSVPALDGIVKLEEELGLIDYGYQVFDYGHNYQYQTLIYTHGYKVNKYSAYTAKNLLDDLGISVISGHTHRMGSHYKTNHSGALVGIENGCLCINDLSFQWFQREVPDWQHGISIIKFVEDRFNVHQVCIPKNKFILYGKQYITL
jgi:predicted phosphodiesterase